MSTRPMECGSCGKDHPSSRKCPKSGPPRMWRHIGGGTLFGSKSQYPSDDIYGNIDTGEEITIFCTTEAHMNMPSQVRKPSDLLRRKGVSKKLVRNP